MISQTLLAASLALGSLIVQPAEAIPANVHARADLNTYLNNQDGISYNGVLANIGAGGSKVQGAYEGVVVASPTKVDPNYFYTWTRDAALTMKALIDRFIRTNDATLRQEIEDYISEQAYLQGIPNLSGGLASGGLGDPKYEVNKTAFTGSWGRPQRDGPPLRATALIAYGNWLIDNGQADSARNIVWPIVSNDLSYTAELWKETGFDLWEEVNGWSFFTVLAQHRALVEGSAFAKKVGQTCTHCDSQAPAVRGCLSNSFWNSGEGFAYTDINVQSSDYTRAGKGTNTLIASIHGFDQDAGCADATFQPCSPRALSNLKVVVDSFRSYPINSNIPAGQAIALGRYIEDVYYFGNPWYLTTLAAAEQLYFALATWNKVGSLEISAVSLPFFQDLYPSAATGVYSSGSQQFTDITNAVRSYADGFFSIIQKYTPQDGSFAEQYSKENGTAVSARDLTWSYASLLTAKAARDGNLPPAWGAASATSVPSTCSGTSAKGPYTTATAVFPPVSCTSASTVRVSFNVNKNTAIGQGILLLGSIAELKSWDANNAIALNANTYVTWNPNWVVEVNVPAGSTFNYKFLQRENGATTFEGGNDRTYTAPSDLCEGRNQVLLVDSWQS